MNYLIVGAGISGFGAAKFLAGKGHHARVSEQSVLHSTTKNSYSDLGIEILDGGHHICHLDGIDVLVPSPGLPANHMLLLAAKERGIPCISEIDLALTEYSGTIFGVTGTNGKSTTVAMIDHALKKLAFSSAPAGNFGDPPTLMMAEARAPEHLVLELSSYQLEQSHRIPCDVSIITSFSSDHLARHGSESEYLKSKWSLIGLAKPNAPVILSADVARAAIRHGLPLPAGSYIVGETIHPELDGTNFVKLTGTRVTGAELKPETATLTRVKGPHNLRNAVFAALSIHLLKKIPLAAAFKALADFPGLPHRCEPVANRQNYSVFNDSKSTNVESTLVALQSMSEPVILLMGGIGKGESYEPILSEKDRIALLLTFGPTGAEIDKTLGAWLKVKNFPTLASLFEQLDGIIKGPDMPILFSPGCASFDEFRNFVHRGEYFSNNIIQVLAKKHAKTYGKI